MKIYYNCSVRWKIDGKNGPVWQTETWLVKAISISDAEKMAFSQAENDQLPQFEVRSATPSTIKLVVDVEEEND
jgi:hypothetical protein